MPGKAKREDEAQIAIQRRKSEIIADSVLTYPDGAPTYAAAHVGNLIDLACELIRRGDQRTAVIAVMFAKLWADSGAVDPEVAPTHAALSLYLGENGLTPWLDVVQSNMVALDRLWTLDGRKDAMIEAILARNLS